MRNINWIKGFRRIGFVITFIAAVFCILAGFNYTRDYSSSDCQIIVSIESDKEMFLYSPIDIEGLGTAYFYDEVPVEVRGKIADDFMRLKGKPLSSIDLGKVVKANYPGSYDHLSDAEIGRKVKVKYPIALELYDGTIIEIPDGTSDAVIKMVAKRETARIKAASSSQPKPLELKYGDSGKVYLDDNGNPISTSHHTFRPDQIEAVEPPRPKSGGDWFAENAPPAKQQTRRARLSDIEGYSPQAGGAIRETYKIENGRLEKINPTGTWIRVKEWNPLLANTNQRFQFDTEKETTYWKLCLLILSSLAIPLVVIQGAISIVAWMFRGFMRPAN
jgi:hypothetical protein